MGWVTSKKYPSKNTHTSEKCKLIFGFYDNKSRLNPLGVLFLLLVSKNCYTLVYPSNHRFCCPSREYPLAFIEGISAYFLRDQDRFLHNTS